MATERFIIPDGDLDTDITLIDTSTGIEYEDNFKDIVDLMNTLYWSKQLLETQILHLKEDLDYYKSKCASLEEGLFQKDRKITKLEKENKELKELVSEVDNELEIRDIVCGAGKFRLEEWGKHRYHQFYKGDEELEDETVVIMLMELEKEKKTLKKENEQLKSDNKDYVKRYSELFDEYKKNKKENEQLKSDKEHLMGCLIRFFGYDDEDIDYNLNRKSNREYGKQYYSMKEETKKELEK